MLIIRKLHIDRIILCHIVFQHFPDRICLIKGLSHTNHIFYRHLIGHVTVIFGNRITQMDDAQVSATELEIWGQGNVQMHVGDDIYFTADAVCLEGFTPAAVLFGRVALQHPGLIIRAESASCNWNEHTVTFYGHVVCIEKGKETVAETLTYDMEENRIK